MPDNTNEIRTETMPVIVLRGLVLFPKMTLHFDIGRKKSMSALDEALKHHRHVLLIPQINMGSDEPDWDEICKIGTIGTVRQVLKVSGDNVRVTVEGLHRAEITERLGDDPYFSAQVRRIEEKIISNELTARAYLKSIRDIFEKYLGINESISPDVFINVLANEEVGSLCDYIASNLMFDYADKQKVLEQTDTEKRAKLLVRLLAGECRIMELEEKINNNAQASIDRNQNEYFLREQMKAISQELGEEESPQDEADRYIEKIRKLNLGQDSEEKLIKETQRLGKMPQGSHEASVIRSYLDVVIELPWNKSTKESCDTAKAEKILDRDHYGLEKVKERIIELIAVRKLAPDLKGQIICLAGPPGVGKTSIVKSIAKATNRRYSRISLGGVRDESDIRGHRKTYIGAMPGRIINALQTAKSNNALILLDEIDKLGSDFKGDPSSALLEVLDAEQNKTFVDHYVEIPFDLSQVLFITTANNVNAIPEPLYDRMEVIEINSYTQEEKLRIAKKYLLPKQLKAHGLTARNLRINEKTMDELIDFYTREAGVRTLERHIASICRKTARGIASGEYESITISGKILEDMLGPHKFKREKEISDSVGIVNGLAWTAVGGELLPVEAMALEGSGKLELTGSLGDVMKESARAALSFIRSRCEALGIDKDFYKTKDIHIHAPEGAVPKDGPSAGVTMITAMVSALSERAAKGRVAMTGEITLHGKVLPIGGLREKSMAAYKNGIKTVLIPKDNTPDLAEISQTVKDNVEFIPVSHIDEVLKIALLDKVNPIDVEVEQIEKGKTAVIPAKSGRVSKRISEGH